MTSSFVYSRNMDSPRLYKGHAGLHIVDGSQLNQEKRLKRSNPAGVLLKTPKLRPKREGIRGSIWVS